VKMEIESMEKETTEIETIEKRPMVKERLKQGNLQLGGKIIIIENKMGKRRRKT